MISNEKHKYILVEKCKTLSKVLEGLKDQSRDKQEANNGSESRDDAEFRLIVNTIVTEQVYSFIFQVNMAILKEFLFDERSATIKSLTSRPLALTFHFTILIISSL